MVIAMTACTEHQRVADRVTLPLTVSLPLDDNYRAQQAPAHRRVLGDPGTTEEFLLPQHLYYFLLRYNAGLDTWKVWQAVDA